MYKNLYGELYISPGKWKGKNEKMIFFVKSSKQNNQE